MQKHEIYHLNSYDCLLSLPSKCIDMVLCAPPTGLTNKRHDEALDWAIIWPQIDRVCKRHASKIFFAYGEFSAFLYGHCPEQYRYRYLWPVAPDYQGTKAPAPWAQDILVFCRCVPVCNEDNHSELLDFKPIPKPERTVPNQKPKELLEFLIKNHSNPDSLILDFAMNCEDTAMAALKCGRYFVGAQSDEQLFNHTQQSLNKYASFSL